MPAPSNSNGLSLGRPVIDLSLIQDPGTRICFEKLLETLIGMASPCGAQAGDDVYQVVYAQNSGGWSLWAGKPTDPLNPDSITGISGSSSIIAQDNGVTIVAAATTLNFGSGLTVTDSGAGVALVDAAAGGGVNAFGTITVTGQSNVEADASPDSVQFAAGTGITITTDAAADKVTWAINTSAVTTLAFKTIQVVGQTDVVADAPDDIAEFVAGANMTITTSADAITFTATNTTYTAGAGVNLSGTKFVADPNTASHVGLVDPTTGDDSSADNAQLGVLWHAIEGFDDGRNQLHGHVADDATKPKVTCKTTEDWLELLESYSSGTSMVIHNDTTNTGVEGDERVRWVASPQKVIWGIDPDGGHTITSTGTTLTLTLKVTKYTFDAVNFVSAVDADVTVNYTGTACT